MITQQIMNQLRSKDPFTVLGLTRKSSAEDKTKAYRKLSLVIHPDKNPDNVQLATELFQLLNNAYETIKEDNYHDPIEKNNNQTNIFTVISFLFKYKNLKPTLKKDFLNKFNISEIIFTFSDLIDVINGINKKHQDIIIDKIKDKLPVLFGNIDDLHIIFFYLNKDNQKIVLDKMEAKLSVMINNVDDLELILVSVSREFHHRIINQIKDKLPEMVKTSFRLMCIMYQINKDNQKIVLDKIGANLSVMINNAADLELILKAVSKEFQPRIINQIKDKLPEIIQTNVELVMLMKTIDDDHLKKVLDNEECSKIICKIFQEKIKTIDDFKVILNSLNDNKCKIICEIFKEKLPQIIKNPRDLVRISNNHIPLKYLYIHICEKYLNQLHQDLTKYQNHDDLKLLTQQKIDIINTAVLKLNTSSINATISYLDSQKHILSQRRDTWLIVFAKIALTAGCIFIYRFIMYLTGTPMTSGMKHLNFFHSFDSVYNKPITKSMS